MKSEVSDPEILTYLHRINRLYETVEAWLRALDKHEARLSRRTIDIEDTNYDEMEDEYTFPEPIRYQAEALVIARPGFYELRLVPKGRYIHGSEGYVEMQGPSSEETFAYMPGVELSDSAAENRARPTEDLPDTEGWYWLSLREYWKVQPLSADIFFRLFEALSR